MNYQYEYSDDDYRLIRQVVGYIDKKYKSTVYNKEDLLQESYFIYCNCKENFDSTKGDWSSYLQKSIRNRLLRFIYNNPKLPNTMCQNSVYNHDYESNILLDEITEVLPVQQQNLIQKLRQDKSIKNIALEQKSSYENIRAKIQRMYDRIKEWHE